jgi:hypothetical protein
MATVKPMQAWALEQQMERQRESRPVATDALLPVAAAMPKFRENTTEPIHNWAASDARGAEFAQRGELQRRDYEQRGKLQDKELLQQKDMLEYKLKLQQKYAPKKRAGGVGPVAKTMDEYIKIASGAPPADERQATANQGRLKILASRLERLGVSGRRALAELQGVGLTPDAYKPAANKRMYEKENITAKGEGQSETATLRAQTAKEIAALRALGSDPSLRPPKDTLLEDAKVTAERAARQQQFRDMATGMMAPIDRSKYVFEDGVWKERD